MAALHYRPIEAGSEPPTKKRRLRKKKMVELHRCLLSIEPPRSKRRRPGAVSCPGIVKSIPLLRQTASVVARLAI